MSVASIQKGSCRATVGLVADKPCLLRGHQQCRLQRRHLLGQHGSRCQKRVQATGQHLSPPQSGVGVQMMLPAAAPLAITLGQACSGQLPTLQVAAAAIAAALLQVASLLFIGYSCSFLFNSASSQLQRIGSAANQSRKLLCSLLQWAHGGAVITSAAWYVMGPHPLPGVLQGWGDVIVVLAAVGSINILLLGWIELRQRLTRKAVKLQLDSLGPGVAHPVMVQGAQVAARHFVSYWVILMNALVAALGIHSADPQCYLSAGIAALMLAQYVSAIAAGEREDAQQGQTI